MKLKRERREICKKLVAHVYEVTHDKKSEKGWMSKAKIKRKKVTKTK